MVHWKGAESEIVVVKFMTVFVARKDSAYSKLRVVTVSPL